MYRVAHLVADLGWVDLDFEWSSVCPIVPWLMGIWLKELHEWERCLNTDIQVKPSQVSDQMGHPVVWMHPTSLYPRTTGSLEAFLLLAASSWLSCFAPGSELCCASLGVEVLLKLKMGILVLSYEMFIQFSVLTGSNYRRACIGLGASWTGMAKSRVLSLSSILFRTSSASVHDRHYAVNTTPLMWSVGMHVDCSCISLNIVLDGRGCLCRWKHDNLCNELTSLM